MKSIECTRKNWGDLTLEDLVKIGFKPSHANRIDDSMLKSRQ